MNSFELTLLEVAARRIRSAASAEMRLELASAPQGIQAISFGDSNKIKAIAAADKYFLTNLSEQFGIDERCGPKAWLH